MRPELKSVFLAWQDPKERNWHTVGRLSQDKDLFVFDYTLGARNESFIPFSGMEKLDMTYKSDRLFPLFANRVLNERRPEYKALLSWLGLSEDERSPLQVLARTGGIKSTDNLQIFPELDLSGSNPLELDFFVHGVRYVSESARQKIRSLKVGDKLLLMHDFQNETDSLALAVRTPSTPEILGYCPRYLSQGLAGLTQDREADLQLTVARINQDAPLYYQLMCKIRARSDKTRNLFNSDEFRTFANLH